MRLIVRISILATLLSLCSAISFAATPTTHGGSTTNLVSGPFQPIAPTPCPYDDADQCFAWGGDGTGTSTICTLDFGCPLCMADNSGKNSICGRLEDAHGFCSCAPKGPITNGTPHCTVSGSCHVRYN